MMVQNHLGKKKKYLLKNNLFFKRTSQTGIPATCGVKESEKGFLPHWEPHPGLWSLSVEVLTGKLAGPCDPVVAPSEEAHLLSRM